MPANIKELILIKIFKRHLKFDLIQSSKLKMNVAILAIFPSNSTLDSLKRVLDGIEKSDFSILAIVNKNSQIGAVLQLLKTYNCTLIVRENIGRDIGAYQCGLNFLGLANLSEDFDAIALINDSLYVTDHNKEFFYDFLMSPSWNCIYLNKQGIHHASSHSLIFDKRALALEDFRRFWKTYYPSSSRLHSIFKGEFGITACLGEDYFKPLVNAEIFYRHQQNLIPTPLEKSQIRIWSRKSGYHGYELLADHLISGQYREALIYCLENFQVSNSIGLLLYRDFKIPIKLDLPSSGVITIESYIDLLAKDITLEEESVLRTRLTPSSPKSEGPIRAGLSQLFTNLKHSTGLR